ncbi:hypothetical protein SBV1_60023 [Verrucomicrobia bacterium]|nr:hypothetical protein SBV1_60023 [Verrucomicrobiota bacterium]
MVLLCDLHRYGAVIFAGKLTSPGKAAVGPFEGFDCQDGSRLHHDGLADFEAGDLLGHPEAQLKVRLLLGVHFGPEVKARGGHEWLEPRGGRDQLHSLFLQLSGDRAKNGVSILFLEAHEQGHRPQIGTQVEKVPWRNLTGHHALRDAPVSECREHLRKLPNSQPDNFVHQGREAGICFALEGNRDEALDSERARLAGKHQGQGTIAGDEAEFISISGRGRWHAHLSHLRTNKADCKLA